MLAQEHHITTQGEGVKGGPGLGQELLLLGCEVIAGQQALARSLGGIVAF